MPYYADKAASFRRLAALPQERIDKVLAERVDPIKSAADRERFKMLPHIVALHANAGIACALTDKGILLGRAASTVHNWLYQPQRAEDKAPRRGADDEIASFVYECSEKGCTSFLELPFAVEAPLCGRHYVERNPDKIEKANERESRREAERIYREGSHYCNECFHRCTPTQGEIDKAAYIGRAPQCPKCKRWCLISALAGDKSETSNDERLSEFELRHDDRWKGRDY